MNVVEFAMIDEFILMAFLPEAAVLVSVRFFYAYSSTPFSVLLLVQTFAVIFLKSCATSCGGVAKCAKLRPFTPA